MKVSVPLDQSCPRERCILLSAPRSPALYSKDRSDPRRLRYERRLEDTAWCVGWGNPRFAARRGFSGSGMGYGMMGGMGQMMGGSMMGGGLFGMLFALVFWVLIVVLIIALVVWIFNQAQ